MLSPSRSNIIDRSMTCKNNLWRAIGRPRFVVSLWTSASLARPFMLQLRARDGSAEEVRVRDVVASSSVALKRCDLWNASICDIVCARHSPERNPATYFSEAGEGQGEKLGDYFLPSNALLTLHRGTSRRMPCDLEGCVRKHSMSGRGLRLWITDLDALGRDCDLRKLRS